MKKRILPLLVLLFPLMTYAGETGKKWTVPRTADGHPDLQGIWTNATITPLQRPKELATKEFFTKEEAAEYETKMSQDRNKDRRDGKPAEDVARGYNDSWYDAGTKVVKTRRTSIVIDPLDGHVPPAAPEAMQHVTARFKAIKERCQRPGCETTDAGLMLPADGPEDRPLTERCIMLATSGPPMLPNAYNNNYQIVQAPGYVAIVVEMIHDVRIIPTDGSPHLPPSVRQYLGDSRGHWEGDTLVVDTTNFTDKTAFSIYARNLHVIERFTRTDADTIMYQFTIDDPSEFTKPWTGEIPMSKTNGPLLEYACHEGNVSLAGVLAAARADEKKAESEKGKGQ